MKPILAAWLLCGASAAYSAEPIKVGAVIPFSGGVDRTFIRTYLMAYIAPGTPDGKPNRAVIDATMPAVREQLAVLDKAVAVTGHLVGDRFTFADINLMPMLHRLGQAPEGGAALAEATHLAAYYQRHAVRPSFVRTDPPAGPPRRA